MNLKSLLVFSSLFPLFLVGREWENYMALSLHEPEVTLCLFIFNSCPVRVCSTHLSFTLLLYCFSVSSQVSATRMAAVDSEAVSEWVTERVLRVDKTKVTWIKISDPDISVPNEPSIAFQSCIRLKAKTLIVGEIEVNVMKNGSILTQCSPSPMCQM